MSLRPKPLTLIILDGWGHREEVAHNAIAAAHKPNWDALCKQYPHTLISGSGRCVGLPDGQMGNSEVGHLTIGSGRVIHQDLSRIDLAIEEGDFFFNPVLIDALQYAKRHHKAVHILGLLSPGGVHSHENHFFAIIKMAAQQGITSLYLHPFLDGRDTPPQSAASSLQLLQANCQQYACGKIATLIGRYYAMDRDQRWDRIEAAYNLLVLGEANYHAETAQAALDMAYARGETDEFVQATTIYENNGKAAVIENGDVVIFMNFRADRARQLTHSLVDTHFNGFNRKKWPKLGDFVGMTEYDAALSIPLAFPPIELSHLLADVLSEHGLTQLRIAETEKYAHVTFFFNGGAEAPRPGEERVLIPSLRVATYDLQPEMSAPALTEELIKRIETGHYDVIICNFANPDMVGHTGNFAATVKAIETIDQCLGRISAVISQVGGELLITADHGNAEQMYDCQTNQPHTAHTNDPVPFLYQGRKAKICKSDGKLSDISPTILYLLGISKPDAMTGSSLVELING